MLNFKTNKGGEKIRKQAILLVITIVFTLALCGAVYAEDSQGGGESYPNNHNGSDSNEYLITASQSENTDKIQGVIKEIYNESSGTYTSMENAIPVQGAIITLKNLSDDSIIATGSTNDQGEYNINFLSGFNQIKVEIAYSTYKPTTLLIDPNISETVLNHTFLPDIAIISSVAEKGMGIKNLNNRRLIYLDMWDPKSSPVNDWIMEHVNFAYLDMAMPGTGWGDSWYPYLLYSPANLNNMISTAFGWPDGGDTDIGGPDDLGLRLLGFKDGEDTINTVENTYVGSYYALATENALETNMEYMVEYIYYLLGETDINPIQNGKSPVMAVPNWGIYHPDYPTKIVSSLPSQEQIKAWIEGNPGYQEPYYSLKWIDEDYNLWASTARNNVYQEFENWYNIYKANITGPFIIIASYGPGGEFSPTIDALIREYESQGRAVFNLYQGATNPPLSSLLEELVRGKDGNGPLERGVSAITSLYSWSLNYANLSGGDGALSELERINLNVLKGVQLSDLGSLNNPLGAQYEWTFAVTFPYFEGVYSPVVISYSDEHGFEHPLDAGIKKLVTLTNQWAKLKETPNADKKIALILYNYPPGKAEMGASYLDVFQSLRDLLIKLKEAGYDLGTEEIPSVEELYTKVAEFGNKGSWAQNLLNQYVQDNQATLEINGQLIEIPTYSEWFHKLPEVLQQQVITKWGHLNGDIMNYNDFLVIPGMMMGNIFITIQPSRGWEEVDNYHDPYLPPHHQYIAFYKWLENIFGANAMIHMGTHGTLEWLPGRNVGLQDDDWPFHLTNIPNINPYIISNPGEGMVAKDRAGALIISHMTPAMVRSGLYGDLILIHDLIHQYDNALNVGNYQILPALESQIKTKAQKLGLSSLPDEEFKTWLEKLHMQLHEIENDIIPLGLHSLGKVLTGDELVEGVFTIAASMTRIMDHMKTVLYPALSVGYYDMQKDVQYEDMLDAIDAQVRIYIEQIVAGIDPEELGVIDDNLLDDLQYCKEIINKIRANQEWDNLLSALNGGFVRPGLAADPAYADVLPTGMNFYASNPKKMPTLAAWETAKQVVDQLLSDYYQKHDKFPETVGMVMWGTELLRTDGIAIAEFLYLLGTKPAWNTNGDVKPVPELIPLENLTITIDGVIMQRPRIDVFTTAVTGNELWINLMNNAVKLAAEASGESTEENYVKKHLSENPSLDRIFGLPGLVLEGTGISDLVPNTSKWQNSDDLASVYLSRVSYAWRSTSDGVKIEQNRNTFQYLLKNADIVTQNIDSTWRLLDTDDYYDWYGGMLLASRSLGGNPEDFLVDIRNKNTVIARTTKEQLELEIRSQFLNPKYMDSLLNTPSGWIEYAKRLENLFGIHATTGAVSDEMWNQVAQNLLDSRFTATSDYQAFATQSMTGWVMEAARRGMWNADASTLAALSDNYIRSTVEYGVSCCHHTCANMAFNQYVMSSSSLSLNNIQQFAEILMHATGRDLGMPLNPGVGPSRPVETTPASPELLNDVPSSTTTGSSTAPGEVEAVEEVMEDQAGLSDSQQAYEVSKAEGSAASSSGVPMAAIMGVILVIVLVGAGYFKDDLMNYFRR